MSKEFYKKLAAIRHRIHQNPELSEQEFETTAFIQEYLSKLGIHPR